MSKLEFTYQHTCEKGVEAYILEKSAFPSLIRRKRNGGKYLPFLGEGYYYWEENLNAAHRWGKNRYRGEYSIVEYKNSSISKNEVLDFLNRRDLEYFNELISIYKERRPKTKNWLLVNWIEFFKKLQKRNKGKFPYRFFRADENLPSNRTNSDVKNKIHLNEKGYYIYLDPLIILCAIDKCDLNAESKTIAH